MVEEALGSGGLEARGIEEQAQLQRVPGDDVRLQRRVRLVHDGEVADAQRIPRGVHRGVDGEVLDDEEGLEEGRAARHVAPPVQSHQGRVLELAQLELLGVELLEPGERGGVVVDVDADGHRVDEEPDGAVDAGDVGGAPRGGGAEDDVALTGVTREHQRPRGLDQCIEGEVVLADEGLEVRGGPGGQVELEALTLERRVRVVGEGTGQRRGRGEATQCLAPVELRGLHRLTLEPGDVVAEDRRIPPDPDQPRANLLVGGEEVLEEEAHAPAVHQHVMRRPERAPRLLIGADDRQTQQRRRAQVEPASAVLGEEDLEAGLLLHLPHSTPVELLPRKRRTRVDELEGFLRAAREEGRAKQGLTLDDGLPGAPERIQVQRATEGPRQLGDVDARARRREGVEEHALLQGRQRIEVLHRRARGNQSVRDGLLQPAQDDVRGLMALRVRRRALGEREQRGVRLLGPGTALETHDPGEGLQRRVLEELLGGELEARVACAGDNLDGEDGVAAQREEVVLARDTRRAQRVGPDGGEDLLLGSLRRGVVGDRGLLALAQRRGEGLAVDLAVGSEGERGEGDEEGRHHVLGQVPLDEVAQRGGVERVAGLRDEPRDEAPVTGGIEVDTRDGLEDGGVA